MSEFVRVTTDAGVGRIVLAAPEKLNAVDAAMLSAITAGVKALAADPGVRVIALTGEGRGFCAGADIAGERAEEVGVEEGGAVDPAVLDGVNSVTRAIVASRTPVIALVNGIAAGYGASMALACDYVLATESAAFMLAFTKIGLMPDGGATALVAASIGRARATRLALLAEKLPARLAAQWGLIAECVPDEDFAARGQEVLAVLGAGAPQAIADTLEAINAATLDLEAALDRETAGQTRLLASADFAEGVQAFLEKRPAQFGRP